jgi:hypothetical protein
VLSTFLVSSGYKLAVTSTGSAVYNERISIILGIITLLLALAVFVSCRTFLSLMHVFGWKNPGENKIYRMFNKLHLWYWWLFGVTLVAHIMMSVIHTGLPQAGDPDAGVHWAILGLGLVSAVMAVLVFSSCRFVPRLLSVQKPDSLLKNVTYNLFYRKHNYYWPLLLVMVAAHFTISFLHAGIWPH